MDDPYDTGDALEDFRTGLNDSPGPAEDLGEDNLTTRLAAKAAQNRARADMLLNRTAAEPQNRTAPPKAEPVDLHSEENLADLEDAGVMKHMSKARESLARYEAEFGKLVNPGKLKETDTANRRALSTLTTQLRELNMALAYIREDVFAQGRAATTLAEGKAPRGYDEILEDSKKCFAKLGNSVSKIGEQLADATVALEKLEATLTLTRRDYETTVDGLMNRCNYFERK